MHSPAAEIARCLAEEAEAVCRHYLSNGRRQGQYWLVGDVENTPGRSLYVRLTGPTSGPGAAGKWTDSATGQHGDLLDLIALTMGIATLKETLEEARGFLSLPQNCRPRVVKAPAFGRRSTVFMRNMPTWFSSMAAPRAVPSALHPPGPTIAA